MKAQESLRVTDEVRREKIEELAKALVRLEERQRQDALAIAEIQRDVKELLRRVR
jgi:hypothetical protein